ncbi:protein of unassigned function [Methylobacterium oryzae CBMB20]|uniref:Protein of unassigned function n=1 Tax=Methylobacterium oryzae CBMB20 TaxID=693986 RepID=A0A089QAB1_9HYPH|nr:protein of unassigned function [Methylobacterium oryzae CBMB20]
MTLGEALYSRRRTRSPVPYKAAHRRPRRGPPLAIQRLRLAA